MRARSRSATAPASSGQPAQTVWSAKGRLALCAEPSRPDGALLLRVPQQEVHVRRALRLDVYLVREQGLTQTDQGEVQPEGEPSKHAVAQNLREGSGNAAHRL